MERYRAVILAALFIGMAILVWLWSSSTVSIEPFITELDPIRSDHQALDRQPESDLMKPEQDAPEPPPVPPPPLPAPMEPTAPQFSPAPVIERTTQPDPKRAVVSGVITLEGQPASRLAVDVEIAQPNGSTRGTPAHTDATGAYTFESTPGELRILFEVVNEKGNHLTHTETLAVAAGRRYQLDYDFPAAGTLRGQVTGIGENEYAGLLVLLGEYSIEANVPEDIYALADEADGEMTVRGDGNYVLDDLEPGRYTVVVITRLLDEQQIQEHEYEFRYFTGYVDVQSGQEAEFNVAFE